VLVVLDRLQVVGVVLVVVEVVQDGVAYPIYADRLNAFALISHIR
jgi:hypothetical protein